MSDYNLSALKAVLSIAFDVNAPENQTWIRQFSKIAKGLASDGVDIAMIPDIIIKNPSAYQSKLPDFFARFKTFYDITQQDTKAGRPPTYSNIASYMNGERQYIQALKKTEGFSDLATVATAQKLMDNGVALDEVTARIDNARYAVLTAPADLKAEIQRMFPSADDASLTRALVTGETDSLVGKLKLQQAEINVAAQRIPGYSVASDTYALAQQGISAEKASQAFGAVSENIVGASLAAGIFGESNADLKTQMEQEALGLTAGETKTKRLASQARAQFEGSTGINAGSLSRARTGTI